MINDSIKKDNWQSVQKARHCILVEKNNVGSHSRKSKLVIGSTSATVSVPVYHQSNVIQIDSN